METIVERVRKNSGLAILAGILLIMVGILAMGSPLVAGLSVAVMVGWLLLFGGISQTLFAIKAKAGIWAIIMGLLTLLAGLYMVSNPGVALASLVMLLAIYLVLSGIAEMILALAARPAEGWGWALVNAIVSFLLGIMIWSQFPLAGALAIGIVLGLKMLFSGLMLLSIGLTVRKAAKSVVQDD